MGFLCKAFRRHSTKRSEGSDRQVLTVQQVGAEDLLTGTGTNNITVNVSNRSHEAPEEEELKEHEEQLPRCDGSKRTVNDVRRTDKSATIDPGPESDLEDQQKHRKRDKQQVVKGTLHFGLELRSRTILRIVGTGPKGRDSQLDRDSKERAEELLSGTRRHSITVTISNNQWWTANEVVNVVYGKQRDGMTKNRKEDDKEDTPDSVQKRVNEKVMKRSVWVDEQHREENPPEKINEWSRMCGWQKETCENRLRHPSNAQRIGEAKNPGPQERRKISDKIEGKLWSCNTGGAPGVFRMITKLQTMKGQKPLVVAMQEPKLSETSHKAVAALAYSTGFFSYHAESKPHKGRWEGEERLHGGLLTLVRTDLQQRLMQKASESDAQVLAVEVAGTIMINVYSPPERCREELATLLCLTTEALRIGPAQPAMWMGD